MPKSYTESILAHIAAQQAEIERLTRKQHMSDLNYGALEKARDSYEREARLHRASLNEVGAERDSLQQQLAEARAKLGTWTSTCTGHYGSQMSCGYYVDAAMLAGKGAT
jgi:chromosome segregation ATPase